MYRALQQGTVCLFKLFKCLLNDTKVSAEIVRSRWSLKILEQDLLALLVYSYIAEQIPNECIVSRSQIVCRSFFTASIYVHLVVTNHVIICTSSDFKNHHCTSANQDMHTYRFTLFLYTVYSNLLIFSTIFFETSYQVVCKEFILWIR